MPGSTALDSCMQRSDHLEIELASHWLFSKIPGSYWLLFTGPRFCFALYSSMQRSDHLEIELASHWLFSKIPGSYGLLFTGPRSCFALYSSMQRSDHLEIELASHWLFFKIPGSYWRYCLQVRGSILPWTVARKDLTTWRLNLLLIGCF